MTMLAAERRLGHSEFGPHGSGLHAQSVFVLSDSHM